MIYCPYCKTKKRNNLFKKNQKRCQACRTEYYRNWYKSNGRKRAPDHQEAIKNWRAINPKATKCHNLIATKTKVRPVFCENCNYWGKLNAHHEDYEKPLEVIWLCYSCHKLKHLQK